jgi:hypothetical protein
MAAHSPLSSWLLSRRRALALAALPVAAALGCRSGSFSCQDLSGLSAEELRARETLEYQERSGEPGRTCAACLQFVEPAGADTCGRCRLLGGPVHPLGSCRAFAARAGPAR